MTSCDRKVRMQVRNKVRKARKIHKKSEIRPVKPVGQIMDSLIGNNREISQEGQLLQKLNDHKN